MSDHFQIKDMIAKGFVETSPGHWRRVTKGNPLTVKPAKKHKYGAKSKDVDGVHYDSQREYAFKQMLDANRILYEMKRKFILQEKFNYRGEAIRQIAIIPDFLIVNQYPNTPYILAVVDVKGMILPDFKIKIKMLKSYFTKQGIGECHNPPIFMPTNKKEMAETITELKKLI